MLTRHRQIVAPAAEMPLPAYEQPALANEAPAEFALIDEFAEPLENEGEAPVRTAADTPAAVTHSPPASRARDRSTTSKARENETRRRHNARHPLRFTWQMDADGHFSLGSDEFSCLIGARTAAGFGRPWRRDRRKLSGSIPPDRMREAIATRETWSGITLYWPVDGGGRLARRAVGTADLRRERANLQAIAASACAAISTASSISPSSAGSSRRRSGRSLSGRHRPAESSTLTPHIRPPARRDGRCSELPDRQPRSPMQFQHQPIWMSAVETPQNVVPFRPLGEAKSPALSPVENHAFNELARQLSARLDRRHASQTGVGCDQRGDGAAGRGARSRPRAGQVSAPASAPQRPEWLAAPEPPARGETRRDRTLLDLLPTGILIYRLDRLLYANPAFLQRIGYDSLHALEQAGGLDALYVEAGVSQASSTSEAGTPMTISASEDQPATEARLFTISWDGESALALMFAPAQGARRSPGRQPTRPRSPRPSPAPSSAAPAVAEDLAAILDTTAEGIVMFDAEGNIHACNRSAEALFGYDGEELLRHNLTDLFAPESRRAGRRISGSGQGRGRRKPARSRPRSARPRRQGRHHPAVDDHGPHPPRRPEFLRRVPRPLAGQEGREANCSRRGGWPIARRVRRPTCWRGSATSCARRSTPSSALPR